MATCARYEPTIDEILADPTVHALMQADRVNPDRLRRTLLDHVSALDTGMPLGFGKARPRGPSASATTQTLRRHVRG